MSTSKILRCWIGLRTNLAYRSGVIVHLVDGTYELFRYFMSPAAAFERTAPEELRAVRGVVTSMLGMLEGGATHLGVATDHVIESFRNGLWPGYKTGEGIDPAAVRPVRAAGGGAARARRRGLGHGRVRGRRRPGRGGVDGRRRSAGRAGRSICTPDKDLAQCVRGDRVVQLDRRTREIRDEVGRRSRSSASRPHRSRTGSRSSATRPTASRPAGLGRQLGRDGAGPLRAPRGHPQAGRASGTSRCAERSGWRATLVEQWERALLFRQAGDLARATRRSASTCDALGWKGPRAEFSDWATTMRRAGAARARRQASLATSSPVGTRSRSRTARV